MYVFVMFWCQLYNGFSGETPFDLVYSMIYPIVFTGFVLSNEFFLVLINHITNDLDFSAQPLIFGIYDQVASKEVLLNAPHLYEITREGKVIFLTISLCFLIKKYFEILKILTF